jgi:hypothetical protein
MMESIDKIAKRLTETQDFCFQVSDHLKEGFLIEGKTMTAWKKYFRIEIPEEINFSTLVSLAQEIMTKYQRAAFFRDSQQVTLTIMEQGKAEKYHEEFQYARTSHQQEFGKPLAAESCKVAATLAVKDLESAISNQKVVHTFWVKTCDTLTEMRKLIELCGYALSGDARVQKDFVVRGGEH